jgi:hypothetical protein
MAPPIDDVPWDEIRSDLEEILFSELGGLMSESVAREKAAAIAVDVHRYWTAALRGDEGATKSLRHATDTARLALARQAIQVQDRVLSVIDRIAGMILKVLT